MLCLLPFTDSSFFTNRRFLVTLCQASLSAVFSDSICLLHVSMSCFGNFSLYFKHFYYYYIYHDLCMIRDLWSNCCKKIMTSRRLRQWLTFFSNKYFLRYANFFRYNAIAHLLYYIDIEVAQSCPSLWDPMDCSLPGSSLHGIFQARILEWVAISFSKLYYSLVETVFIYTGKSKNSCALLYCSTLFIRMVWNGICSIWEEDL